MKIFQILTLLLIPVSFVRGEARAEHVYNFFCDGEKIYEDGRSLKLRGHYDSSIKAVMIAPDQYINLSANCSGNLEASRKNLLFSILGHRVPVAPERGFAFKEMDSEWVDVFTAPSSSVDEEERRMLPILDNLEASHHFADEGILRSVTVSPNALVILADPMVYKQTKGKDDLTIYLRNKGMLLAPAAMYLGLNGVVYHKDLRILADNWIDDHIAEGWSFPEIGEFLVNNILPHAGYDISEIEQLVSPFR